MWTMEGTHTGEWFGTPATGKHAKWSGVVITRFADGKIAEDWYNFDQISLLQQLGIIPT
jgi:predicted ester cyclase